LAPLSGSDSDVRLVGSGARPSSMASDSDVALLPSSQPGSGIGLGGLSLAMDDDVGSALLDGDDDAGIVLPGDSGIRLSGDSGIQLRQPADSGILLEGEDSGIQLSTGSSIKLGGDSGFRLAPTGGSSRKIKGGSSKNLKGRKGDDDLDTTSPMLLTQNDDDDLGMTSPMLLGSDDDDLNSTDLEMPMLSEDDGGSAKRGAVVMFDDDDDDATDTVAKTGGKKSSDDSGFDFDDDVSAEDDELEVSDEVLGEDDELEDLDAFDSDDDEYDENFEAGASQLGFGRRDKVVVPQEPEWGTGFFLGLLASSFLLMAGALLSVDLLRMTWAGNETAVYQGELIGMFNGLF